MAQMRVCIVYDCLFPHTVGGAERWYRNLAERHEVWSRDYWRSYLGRAGGEVGWLVQRLCVRVRQRAFCFSRLHANRLREEGLHRDITILPGEYDGPLDSRPELEPEPVIVFAGR